MSDSRVLEIAQDLIRFPSISSHSNAAVSDYVQAHLERLGFVIERIEYVDARNQRKVNLVARRGEGTGGLAYSGHTDVVPVDDWVPNPAAAFEPKIVDGRLYGRGSCDMKGSVAAALVAAEQIDVWKQTAPLYFLISSDEEIGMLGARRIAAESKIYRSMVQGGAVAIVGEPTEFNVYYAHKGTLRISLISRGKSAHSSSADGINANHKLFSILPALEEVRQRCEFDELLQNPMFNPPTMSWNWVIRNEPFASNITPSLAEIQIFLRPMPGVNHEPMVHEIERIARHGGVEFIRSEDNPPLNGDPNSGLALNMLAMAGGTAAKTACYATDGGVLQELAEIVVCGPGSIAQAHRNDEYITLEQLDRGVEVYRTAFEKYCY